MLVLVACGTSPATPSVTASADSTSTDDADSTGATTSAGTSTSGGLTPTVDICDALEPVVGRTRRCVVLHRGGLARVHGVDLDGDGTDEIFAGSGSVGESSFEGAALFRWTGTDVVGGDLGFGTRVAWALRCWVRFDFDGDGTKDLDCLGQGRSLPSVLRIVDGDLAGRIEQLGFVEPEFIQPSGAASVVDPDEDGVYERMITIGWPPEIGGFGLFREQDGVLVP
ncbi:MAG: VCBS repeat-containing protein, partial [Nannocystaceae bacterium]